MKINSSKHILEQGGKKRKKKKKEIIGNSYCIMLQLHKQVIMSIFLASIMFGFEWHFASNIQTSYLWAVSFVILNYVCLCFLLCWVTWVGNVCWYVEHYLISFSFFVFGFYSPEYAFLCTPPLACICIFIPNIVVYILLDLLCCCGESTYASDQSWFPPLIYFNVLFYAIQMIQNKSESKTSTQTSM